MLLDITGMAKEEACQCQSATEGDDKVTIIHDDPASLPRAADRYTISTKEGRKYKSLGKYDSSTPQIWKPICKIDP